ncbi:hypothetical protein [Rhizobium rhizogenes]|uniref:hypothetical protein n=1 Tax=Rhizobium rhizogenes TaxID=359 RepID=UPI0015745FF1|nr:hypothetical protein [Rhizobium rhizogenes]NTF67685.1 hypothetical protein [Rhizobium rhizogenes]
MNTQISRNKGTAAEIAAYTGVPGEFVYNETKGAINVMNGVAPGGIGRTLMTTELGQPSGVADLDSGGQVPSSRLNNITFRSFATRAALMAGIAALAAGTVVFLTEGSRAGEFIVRDGNYSTQVTADPQQGVFLPTTVDPTGATRVAIRQGIGRVAPEWCGAAGDNITNDTAAVQAALNLAPYTTLFNQRVAITQQYLCDGLNIPAGITLEGNNQAAGDLIPGGNPYAFLSQIRLRSGATIGLQRSSVLQRVVLVHDGLLTSVTTDAQATTLLTQFGGTAVSMPYRDAQARDLLILGFDLGIQAVAANSNEGRPVIEGCRFDCKNPVYIGSWYDIPQLRHCHAWPFLTAHVTGLSNINLCRNGTGYQLDGINDWMTAFDCFSFGHMYGFRITGSASNVCLLRCQADHIGTAGATAAGISIEDTASTSRLIGCTVNSHLVAVRHPSTGAGVTKIDNCLFAVQDVCVDHLGGNIRATNNQFRSGTYGFRTSATITGANYSGSDFSGLSGAGYNVNATTASLVRIDGNSPSISTTAVVTANSGAITTATANLSYMLYETSGRAWVECDIDVVITTNGTGAGSVRVALPWTSNINRTFVGSQENVGGAACLFKVNSGSNVLTIAKYDNSYPGADGVTLRGRINIRLP